MKKEFLEIAWISISIIVIIISSFCITNSSIILNTTGFVTGILWIIISWFTKCFTKFIK